MRTATFTTRKKRLASVFFLPCKLRKIDPSINIKILPESHIIKNNGGMPNDQKRGVFIHSRMINGAVRKKPPNAATIGLFSNLLIT
jgi:hypothetical protein